MNMGALKILFLVLTVIGAVGSIVVNTIIKGELVISYQWAGAALLYAALLARNVT